MKTFASQGDVDGEDAATTAFNKAELVTMNDIVVPGSIARTQQLLNTYPSHNILGPYEATNTNTKATKCRMAAYTTFELTETVLGAKLTDRQAKELIVSFLSDTGNDSIYSHKWTYLMWLLCIRMPTTQSLWPCNLMWGPRDTCPAQRW
jgi:hypothetical protein